MSEKTLVPIFVFWAFLTIITPTLILLSENSKADDFHFNGNKTGGFVKSRRMMDKNDTIRFRAQPALKMKVAAPAPTPTPSSNSMGSHHSNSLFHHQRNNTHVTTEEYGHYKPTLSPENKYVKQQTSADPQALDVMRVPTTM